MLARTPIYTLFYQYVCKRDPNERYYWSDYGNCACAQFVRDEGIDTSDSEIYRAIWGRCHLDLTFSTAPDSLNGIAYGSNRSAFWTFGTLRERLEDAGYGA